MKMKQWICGLLCAAMTVSVPMTAMASNDDEGHFSAEEFVTEYYDAVNGHDWEAVASYHDWDKSEEMRDFLTDVSNQQNYKGLLNVGHVEALEIVAKR